MTIDSDFFSIINSMPRIPDSFHKETFFFRFYKEISLLHIEMVEAMSEEFVNIHSLGIFTIFHLSPFKRGCSSSFE